MKIALISSTVLPAVEPDDPTHVSCYGSETMNCVLARGLADRGHHVLFYAPRGSTTFNDHSNIEFHPIIDSNGAHLPDERLEKVSGDRTGDLTNCDFVIDCSKQNHVTEELSMWFNYNKFAHWKSGYKDWTFPMRIKPRHVTHCFYFKEFFEKNGHPADVARFGLSDFWCDGVGWFDYSNALGWNLEPGEYFLYPHRPNVEKGAQTVVKLAQEFKQYKFVIQTGLKFDDHFREWNAFKESCKGMENVVFIELPQNNVYQRYRRSIMRNALAILSLFSEHDGYMDTGGLVSCEAVRCGTPIIVTRSPGSEELLGMLEGKGVTFTDGYESAKMAIKFKSFETRPRVDTSWMSVSQYVDDWMNIIQKWS